MVPKNHQGVGVGLVVVDWSVRGCDFFVVFVFIGVEVRMIAL